jgi:kynurenine formamidase
MRTVDLSFPISDGMPRYPSDHHPEVRVEITGTHAQHRAEVRRLIMGTHSGTHIDAPRHFLAGGMTIDAVPLGMLITEAVVFDAPGEPGGVIGAREIPAGAMGGAQTAIIRTGWWRRWGADFFDNPPRLEVTAAAALLDAGVVSIAADFPLGRGIHELVLGRGKLLIENIGGLDELRARRCWLAALPLKVAEGDGAPARVVAVEL